MQTISGTIQSVGPPVGSDQWGNQYQYITINTPNGPITGRIGTKKPYTTQNLNQQGQWEVTQGADQSGQPENKFKKHYDTPYRGGQYAPQNAPQGPPQAAGTPNVPQNKDMHIMRLAVLKAVLSATEIPLDMVRDYLMAGVQFTFTGKWAVTPAMPSSATPSPAMGGDEQGPPATEDDIPWEN